MESLLYYFNSLGIDPVMCGLFSLIPISLFLFVYIIGCCSKTKTRISSKKYEQRVSTLENSVKTLYEHMLKYNTRLEGFELNMGKILLAHKDIDNLKQDLADLEDKNEEFNKHYKEFYAHVIHELGILHDATFVPDEPEQHDDDSDYEP